MTIPSSLLTATAGSRALDAEIARALGADVTTSHGRMGHAIRDCPWWDFDTIRWISMPRWSHDMSAAVDLVQDVLKPWAITVEVFTASAVCQIHSPQNGETTRRLTAPTAPLALLKALFAAREAGEAG